MNPDLTLPARHFFISGVYGLRRKNKYIYIGASNNIFRRILHLRKVISAGDKIDIWFVDRENLFRFERDLIRKYRPRLNTTHAIKRPLVCRANAVIRQIELGYVHHRRGSEPTYKFGEQSSPEVATAVAEARAYLRG